MSTLAIYGASGHGKVVADIAWENGYDEIIFIDDGDNIYITFDTFLKEYANTPVALGVGVNNVRAKLYKKCIEAGLKVETLIHPTATISKSAQVDNGTVVMAYVVINADVHIGKGCILNTSCVIEHDSKLGDFVHISPVAACAGDVRVGEFTHIGIGSCIIQNINIGSYSIIGAGSVVVEDLDAQILAYGNPCKKIKGIK